MACVLALLPRRKPVSTAALISFCSGLALGREHFLVSYLPNNVKSAAELAAPSSTLISKLEGSKSLDDLPQLRLEGRSPEWNERQHAVGHYRTEAWNWFFKPEVEESIGESYFPKPKKKDRTAPGRDNRKSLSVHGNDQHLGRTGIAASAAGPGAVQSSAASAVVVPLKPPPDMVETAGILKQFLIAQMNVSPEQAAKCLDFLNIKAELGDKDKAWEGHMLEIGKQPGIETQQLMQTLRRLLQRAPIDVLPPYFGLKMLHSSRRLADLARQSKAIQDIPRITASVSEAAEASINSFYRDAAFLDEEEIHLTQNNPQLSTVFCEALAAKRTSEDFARNNPDAMNPVAHWLTLRFFGSPDPENISWAKWHPAPRMVYRSLAALIYRCHTMPIDVKIDDEQIRLAFGFVHAHDQACYLDLNDQLKQARSHRVIDMMRDVALRLGQAAPEHGVDTFSTSY